MPSFVDIIRTTKTVISLSMKCKWAAATEFTAVFANQCWQMCKEMDNEMLKEMMSCCSWNIATGINIVSMLDAGEEYFYRTLYHLYSTDQLPELNSKQMAILGFAGVMYVGCGIYTLINIAENDALLAVGTVTAINNACANTTSSWVNLFKEERPAKAKENLLEDEEDNENGYKPPVNKQKIRATN